VWIALHGYAQLASTFASSARWPAAPARAFVFPESLQRFYLSDGTRPQQNATAAIGASWMTREAREDDIADNLAYLDAIAAEVRTSAPQAVFTVLGFSQGTATATRWASARAAAGDPPARLVSWGGVFAHDADFGADAPLRRVSAALVYGTRDRWMHAERVAAERRRLDEAGFPYEVREFDGGHRLDDALLAALAG
jgi:predicted esterase